MKPNPYRSYRDSIYSQLSLIGKAISSPKRIELLELIIQAKRTVEVLAREASLTVANTSKHLQVLKAARLVDTERSGTYVMYRVVDESVEALFGIVSKLGKQHIDEIARLTDSFFGKRDGMEPLGSRELMSRIKDKSVIVIDARPTEEYRAGHLPSALSIPFSDLAGRLNELPKNRTIVAYCRGPYCVLALKTVEMLRARGYRAKRMNEGVGDWRAKGLPVISEKQDRPKDFPP